MATDSGEYQKYSMYRWVDELKALPLEQLAQDMFNSFSKA